ncbi:MAG: DNA-directed RNA polymerase subunit beta' [Oscillospiraceae bacterium]|nr:DNA-directed RNA polymerase subunit beta' [Oscillospiraceae bacterium]
MVNENNYNELNFESIKIGLASPEKIRQWSYGEVKKPETINYRTLKPERDGLFCERIFGPQKDWECHCGKYKRIRFKGKTCERCGVKITKSKVRRERMGHIELAAPVSHIWYFKGIPSRMGLILDVSPRDLEKVLYFAKYIVTEVYEEGIDVEKYQILSDKDYGELIEKYGAESFRAGMGAETVRELLAEIDVDFLAEQLRAGLDEAGGQVKTRILKRLEVVEAFRQSGNRPEWMILDVVPVIPPDLRPMVQLEGGRFATSDLNDLYRRVINRNNRLKKLLELGAPEIIVRNEKRMLQEAVDALIDNGRRGRPVTGPNNRPLKSLSDMLKGKQGRFRQNLLGKRVDYSGRSVIVAGPEQKIYQCGLPKEMALELFKPFVMKRLVELDISKNIKSARKMVERASTEVWDALETVIKDHPVMLNRAPTLHRLGIQAFEPVLVEGRAIKLHPLVCTAFNADFDGDQMAVHVPLSAEAQAEARFLMLAANNLLKPSDGKPVTVPSLDMVLGSYYLTLRIEGAKGEGNIYRDVNEAVMACDEGDLDMHALIKVRIKKEIDGEPVYKIITTTLGRIIFNEPIPQDLGFSDRSKPDSIFDLEIDFLVDKKMISKIIERTIKVHGTSTAAEVLDKIKSQGYKYSTISGITIAVSDAVIPNTKKQYIEEAENSVDSIMKSYRRGECSEKDRSKHIIETWEACTKKVSAELKSGLDTQNPLFMMVDSGARSSVSQLSQMAGMRGLIANTAGRTIEIPIRSNYREGLNVLEYFISSRGARKGLADTALRTADSGYLTRRLVDVSQDVIVREEDCGCESGYTISNILGEDDENIEMLSERLVGRMLFEPVIDEKTGEIIMDTDIMITEDDAKRIIDAGFNDVKIRSPLTCKTQHGVCIKCYGSNLATGDPVTVGEAVGIIAAQSIGEPGTQLTMRTFHTGGVVSTDDITQGLPRVEELFEARKPKTLAIISRIDGIVSFEEIKKNLSTINNVVVTNMEAQEKYTIPYGFRICVADGQSIKKGDTVTEGSVNPHDVLEVLGVEAVQNYLIKEVQRVYRLQGVEINDKHIEVIVRQMMKKTRITECGTTNLLPGVVLEINELEEVNEREKKKAEEKGEIFAPAAGVPVLLGITKASLATDSFLSAASFQETTRVLTDAAIKGKSDPLIGLKENVIIGKLLPSGTGMKCYSDVAVLPENIGEYSLDDFNEIGMISL